MKQLNDRYTCIIVLRSNCNNHFSGSLILDSANIEQKSHQELYQGLLGEIVMSIPLHQEGIELGPAGLVPNVRTITLRGII